MQAARGFQNVFAKTVAIGERRAFFVNSAVDAASEMLDEVAVDVAINFADLAIKIYFDARGCGGRGGLLGRRRRQRRRGFVRAQRRGKQRECGGTEGRSNPLLQEIAPSGKLDGHRKCLRSRRASFPRIRKMDTIHGRNAGRVSGMSIHEKTFTRQQGIIVSLISHQGWGNLCD